METKGSVTFFCVEDEPIKSNWKYYPKKRIILNEETGYDVDLDRMNNPAEALDWILQIATKSPRERWDVAGLIFTFKEAVWERFGNSAQGVYCPMGQNMEVDWEKGTYHESRNQG